MGGAAIVRLKVVEQVAVLSSKRGGSATNLKTYCLYFQERPQQIERRMLCDDCPDHGVCADNPPPAVKAVWLYVK